MEPFMRVQKLLESDKYVTESLVIPQIYHLREGLKKAFVDLGEPVSADSRDKAAAWSAVDIPCKSSSILEPFLEYFDRLKQFCKSVQTMGVRTDRSDFDCERWTRQSSLEKSDRGFSPPRPSYSHARPAARQRPREVRAGELSFKIKRVQIANHRERLTGEILYEIQVTMNDGYKYSVFRRYSQFDQFRARVAPIMRVVTAPFPPKYGVRATTVRLSPAKIRNRKAKLQSWLQSICTAASANLPRLRLPVYNFLETSLHYPPKPTSVTEIAASPAPRARVRASVPATRVPYAPTTPYPGAAVVAPRHYGTLQTANFNAATSDGWAVPIQSRQASDMTFAMSGPHAFGKLEAGKVAEVLRSNTGALPDDLRVIWELCDMDKDGMLDRDEFAVAWYLATMAAAGWRPPASLPANLIPLSKRVIPCVSAANPF